jgi:hypothetical protein
MTIRGHQFLTRQLLYFVSTGCSAGTVKKYPLFAQARKHPDHGISKCSNISELSPPDNRPRDNSWPVQ